MLIGEAEKLYTSLTERFVCEVVNGSVTNALTRPAALPSALPLEGDNKQEQHQQQNDVPSKDE
jgi:hypothetical protein